MKKSKNGSGEEWPAKRKVWALAGVIVALAAVILAGGYLLFKMNTVNYAEEVATPLEVSLIRNGAVKKCDRGDSGRGPDNRQPWYGAVFEVTRDVESTKELVKRSLAENAFSLEKFDFSEQHSEWTVWDKSHSSPYSSLENGHVDLKISIYEQKHFDATKDAEFCTLSGQGGAAEVTTFAIGVNLPQYR